MSKEEVHEPIKMPDFLQVCPKFHMLLQIVCEKLQRFCNAAKVLH